MALFTGVVVNKLDRKGRVSVPAPYRNGLLKRDPRGEISVYPAPDEVPAIEGSGTDRIEEIAARFGEADPFDSKFAKARLAFFPNVVTLAFDQDGRVTLTDALIAHAGLAGQAAFVGLGGHFQIWEPAALKEARHAARALFADEGSRPELPPAPGRRE